MAFPDPSFAPARLAAFYSAAPNTLLGLAPELKSDIFKQAGVAVLYRLMRVCKETKHFVLNDRACKILMGLLISEADDTREDAHPNPVEDGLYTFSDLKAHLPRFFTPHKTEHLTDMFQVNRWDEWAGRDYEYSDKPVQKKCKYVEYKIAYAWGTPDDVPGELAKHYEAQSATRTGIIAS